MKTLASQQHGTFAEFITDRLPSLSNAEHMEAFGRELYNTTLQLVLIHANGFSNEAVNGFPLIEGKDYALSSLFKWVLQMQAWFLTLSDKEQLTFMCAQFSWDL